MIDKRIIYPNDNGGVSIVVPAPDSNLSIDEIIKQTVPSGKPYKVVDVSEIPTDRTFRSAWEYQS